VAQAPRRKDADAAARAAAHRLAVIPRWRGPVLLAIAATYVVITIAVGP
jgi:hypothetical protein